MLELLMISPVVWAIFACITILSFVLTIVSWQKGKERKEFSYCLSSSYLIRKKKKRFVKLAVTYDGKQIDGFCVSRLTIWNSGNKTLNRDDMVTSKELTITTTANSKILDAEIIACSEETNKFSVQIIDEQTVKILFEYVDKREGVVVQIMHSGTNNSLKIDCKIKGGLPIKEFISETAPRIVHNLLVKNVTHKFFGVVAIATIVFWFVVAIVATILSLDGSIINVLLGETQTGNITFPDGQNPAGVVVELMGLWLIFLFCWKLLVPIIKVEMKIGMPSSLKRLSSFNN